MSLTINNDIALMEKITSNQGWSRDNIQHCKKSEEVKEEVCVLSTKMDLLLNWLEQRANYKKDRQALQEAYNSQIICEFCGNIGHSGNNCPETQKKVNFIKYGHQQQGQGWDQQQWSNYQGKYPGNYYNSLNHNEPSLEDFILEQARINENISKKLASNDKILENINTKMDSFSSAIKDQLSYNKKIESQIAQLAAYLPFVTNLQVASLLVILHI